MWQHTETFIWFQVLAPLSLLHIACYPPTFGPSCGASCRRLHGGGGGDSATTWDTHCSPSHSRYAPICWFLGFRERGHCMLIKRRCPRGASTFTLTNDGLVRQLQHPQRSQSTIAITSFLTTPTILGITTRLTFSHASIETEFGRDQRSATHSAAEIEDPELLPHALLDFAKYREVSPNGSSTIESLSSRWNVRYLPIVSSGSRDQSRLTYHPMSPETKQKPPPPFLSAIEAATLPSASAK